MTLDLRLWHDAERDYDDYVEMDRQYGGGYGGTQFAIDAFNPFGLYHTIRRPSMMGLAHHAYVGTILAGAMAFAASLNTVSGQGLTLQRFIMTKHWLAAKGSQRLGQAFARMAPYVAFGAGVYVAGQYTGRAIYKSTTISTGGDYMRTHYGGHYSFRNPMTGM